MSYLNNQEELKIFKEIEKCLYTFDNLVKINTENRVTNKLQFSNYQGENSLENAWYDACIEELGQRCHVFGYSLEDLSNELAWALTDVVIDIAMPEDIAQQETF